ncbi:NACHT, LRR and PYD domains-containing protein 3-like [Alosa pseudoharengus]|uniref:NACHT, LRR and PYD domains-containing protein 3-like n=1 Tax=Alosa pseudoharengus TaxID=34774 RepID=UPI003F8BFA8E
MKSHCSCRTPPNFSPDVKQDEGQDSPEDSAVSMRSAEDTPLDNSELSDGRLSLGPARCDVCMKGLTDPVTSITCGHRFCVDCISSYLDQSGTATFSDCPVCGKDALKTVIQAHKLNLKRRFESVSEGSACSETRTLLENIYTELQITEGESEGVNKEHEVRQLESTLKTQASADTAINCNDIFKPLPGQERHIRTVITKGIAGVGKTVSVQKFILDWAEGRANQDVDFMFVLPFREANLIKDTEYSLHGLLLKFHPELKGLRSSKQYQACQLVFIFDGLDESQHTLTFPGAPILLDVTQTSSVEALITNLIIGSLLPSARVWITSRPAAADQIPSEYIHRVTEVQGFSEPQKEEYFRKRISDPSRAVRIIAHLKASKNLHVMCHIPVFCWIAATVLQEIWDQSGTAIPKTLTEMFIHFLLIQTIAKSHKYDQGSGSGEQVKILKSNLGIILKLAKLAFKHLEKGNLMFYEEDLREDGIDVHDAAVYSGMCTEIFRAESLFGQAKVYSFVHVTIQEFLAAFFIFHSYMTKNREGLMSFFPDETSNPKSTNTAVGPLKGLFKKRTTAQPEDLALHTLLKAAVDKSLQSKNGHLDLFLRFLLGISLEANQRLLQGLLSGTENTSKGIGRTIAYVKSMNETHVSPERYINLFHCLLEMNDHTIHEKIERYLKSEKEQKKTLSPSHCSALASMLMMSGKTLDELDLKKYNTSDEGRKRLLPVVRCCKKAVLAGCNLSPKCIELVLSSLALVNSPLRELDLSESHLQDSVAQHLTDQLRNPLCKLDSLRLSSCGMTEHRCASLASILSYPTSCLRVLDLSNNQLYDAGAKLLTDQLGSPHCKLETLRLSSCRLSELGCDSLTRAVSSKSSRVRELDLRHNHVGQSAAHLLLSAVQHPQCKLETLGLNGVSDLWLEVGPGKYSCELTLDENSANDHLAFTEECTKVLFLEDPQLYSNRPDRFSFWPQVLCKEALSSPCYWELEWKERVDVGVAYADIQRKLEEDQCVLGHNDLSWSLECHNGHRYTFWRSSRKLDLFAPHHIRSRRVGVFLNWPAGALSFYSVATDTIHHLHTYQTKFSEPLHAGFMVWPDSSVTLCKIPMRGATSIPQDAEVRRLPRSESQ